MNLKIALATAILLTGGAYASDAQQKTAVAQSVSAAKTFENKVKEYQNADASKLAGLQAELTQMMAADMGTAKADIANAGDDATREKANKKFESRMNAMNEATKLMQANAEKKSVVAALKKFAETLK